MAATSIRLALRRVLQLTAAVITLIAVPALAEGPGPLASVMQGQLRGSALEKGGAVFKGIPFAQSPVGDLRWRSPAPPKPWSGVREATAFGAPCAQNAGGRMLDGSNEDCLFLNIWTPEWPVRSRRPVMVWMHGGGNYGGTASSANFDGESLARHGVVVVTTNYRLNIFGFFAHPELTRESAHHASGNYGLMDQVAALEWVRENIAKFGGDPSNVTIFGQSAGAVDVNVLMTSPLAKGLFRRVIAQSGTVTRNPDDATLGMTALGALMRVKTGPVTWSDAPGLAEAETAGQELAAMAKAPVSGTLKYLRDLPAAELLKVVAAPRLSIGPANGVVVDGWVLPAAPAEVFASGKEFRVPLLIGNNSRERTPPSVTKEDLTKAVEAMYGPLAPRAVALYGLSSENPGRPDDPIYGGTAAQWVVDTMYRCPVVVQLAWHTSAGNPGFEYQFDRAAAGREALGAVHGAEVPYVFASLSSGRGVTYGDVDHEISAAIEQYWTNFAKTGNPSAVSEQGKLPRWPGFDRTAQAYMEFTDSAPAAREGLRRPYCDLYAENVKRLMAQPGR